MNASQYMDIRCVVRRLDGLRYAPPILRVMKDRRVCRMGEVKRNPSGARWDSGEDGLPRTSSNLLDFDGLRCAPPILRVAKDRRVCRMGGVKRNPSGAKWNSVTAGWHDE